MPAGLPATWLNAGWITSYLLNVGWITSYLVECRLDYLQLG
jgi:hypothetical protein